MQLLAIAYFAVLAAIVVLVVWALVLAIQALRIYIRRNQV